MNIGFYGGSFDPFTFGHLHVVKTACSVFDKIIIGIGENPKKTRRYDKILMQHAIEKLLINEKIRNAVVVIYDNLPGDAAIRYGANFLIRGVRDGMDYNFEEKLALLNQEATGIDTIYFRAGEFKSVSSSFVYELIKHNKDVSKYVPKVILKEINKTSK